MRRLLLIASAAAVLVGCFVGVASARLAVERDSQPESAPLRAPVVAPTAAAGAPGNYSYRSPESIGAIQSAAPAAAAASGSSASVEVTAIVLPVFTVVLDKDGDVRRIVANTVDRDASGVLFQFRSGSESGELVELDAPTWNAARAALARATAGAGTIYTA